MRRIPRMATSVVLSATLIILCLGVTVPVLSQGGFGVIAGKVTDPTGASVPNAKIRAINLETNARSEVTSNANGDYQILQLLPGHYRLQVEAAGFKLLERPDIQVQVSDRVTLDVALEIGEITETVTVTSDAPLLRTQDAQTGDVITSAMIEKLPQLNRDPLQLLTLAGNVQGPKMQLLSIENHGSQQIQ